MRQQGAAAAGGQQLRAAETQHANVAPRAGPPALHRRPRRLGRVLDHRDASCRGQLRQLPHGDQAAVEVRDDHRPHRGADASARDSGRGSSRRVHVGQHRPGADGVDGEEVAGIVVGGQHHLVAGADLEGAQGQFDRERTAGADGGKATPCSARRCSSRSTPPPWYLPHEPSRQADATLRHGFVQRRPVRRPFGADRRSAEQSGGGSAGFIADSPGARRLP